MKFPPVFLQRVREAFADRIKSDCLQSRLFGDPGSVPLPPSIRVLISGLVVARHAARKKGSGPKAALPVLDLSDTLYGLSSTQPRSTSGADVCVGQLMDVCHGMIPQLLFDVSCYCPSTPKSVAEHQQLADALKIFLGVPERDAFRALESPPYSVELTDILFMDLLYLVGHKQLSSFYRNERSTEGWYRDGPQLFTGFGEPLDRHSVETPHGQVTIRVSRYTEETGSLTRPYEWLATMQADPYTPFPPVDAYACGMIYVGPKRVNARSATDLISASDAVADVDVLQVKAFLDQDDAEEVWEQSDLCFVWLWERAEHAAKGAGAACLKAALSDIKKRFNRVRTVIVDCQPLQFQLDPWSELDPAEIAEARLEATASLHSYTAQLGLGDAVGGELRFIANIHQGSEEAALLALGQVWLEGRA